MEVWQILSPENIYLKKVFPQKSTVLRFIASECVRKNIVQNEALLYRGFEEREATMSTGIGNGIGLPHTTSSEAKSPTVIFIQLTTPIEFDALDHCPVDIILSLVIPENNRALHLQLLARISRLLKSPKFISAMRLAESVDTFLKTIREIEETMALCPNRPDRNRP